MNSASEEFALMFGILFAKEIIDIKKATKTGSFFYGSDSII